MRANGWSKGYWLFQHFGSGESTGQSFKGDFLNCLRARLSYRNP